MGITSLPLAPHLSVGNMLAEMLATLPSNPKTFKIQ
jgi:hypothetical protein